MVEEQKLNEDLEQFASALSGLTPRPSDVDRRLVIRELMTIERELELLSMQQRLRFWKRVSCFSAATSTILAILLIVVRASQPTLASPALVNRSKDIRAGVSQTASPATQAGDANSIAVRNGRNFDASYIDLRNLALAEGVEVLSSAASTIKQASSSIEGDLWPFEFPDARFGG